MLESTYSGWNTRSRGRVNSGMGVATDIGVRLRSPSLRSFLFLSPLTLGLRAGSLDGHRTLKFHSSISGDSVVTPGDLQRA